MKSLAPLCVVAVLFATPTLQAQNEELKTRASWTPPTVAEVKAQLDKHVAELKLGEAEKLQLEALWPEGAEPIAQELVLDQVAATLAVLDKSAKELVKTCQKTPGIGVRDYAFLKDEKTPEFARRNLRLYYGRWLSQNELYDEAFQQLDGLKATEVVAPSTLLFHQSVAYHRLLKKDKCLPTVTKLLENEGRIPRRYEQVAKLMEADLKPLKTDSLDEVARLMDDIRRRLGLGRAGKRVRKQEDDVIAKLDKMIKEMEEQLQQQQQQQGSSSSNSPSSPLDDSRAMQGKGPGNVDQKKVASGPSWGDLPPAKRRAALQQISRELGAHYRDVIEQYFRKLARDSE